MTVELLVVNIQVVFPTTYLAVGVTEGLSLTKWTINLDKLYELNPVHAGKLFKSTMHCVSPLDQAKTWQRFPPPTPFDYFPKLFCI